MSLFDDIVRSTKTKDEILKEQRAREQAHLEACIRERIDYIIEFIVKELKDAASKGNRSIAVLPDYRYETADSWAYDNFRDVSDIDSRQTRPFRFLLRTELKEIYDEGAWGAIPSCYQEQIVRIISDYLEKEGFKTFIVEFSKKQRGYINGKLKTISKCKYWKRLSVSITW